MFRVLVFGVAVIDFIAHDVRVFHRFSGDLDVVLSIEITAEQPVFRGVVQFLVDDLQGLQFAVDECGDGFFRIFFLRIDRDEPVRQTGVDRLVPLVDVAGTDPFDQHQRGRAVGVFRQEAVIGGTDVAVAEDLLVVDEEARAVVRVAPGLLDFFIVDVDILARQRLVREEHGKGVHAVLFVRVHVPGDDADVTVLRIPGDRVAGFLEGAVLLKAAGFEFSGPDVQSVFR